jgi:hypothetical protein
MVPLFDLAPLVAPQPAVAARPPRAGKAEAGTERASGVSPTPVEYWVRGVFRCGDGQVTRTVQAVGMSARLDADVAKFVRYLADEGFQFAEGRGYLAELLGVGADDGARIQAGAGGKGGERCVICRGDSCALHHPDRLRPH